MVETTVTVIVSGRYTPAVSAATRSTRPAASPLIVAVVPGELAGIVTNRTVGFAMKLSLDVMRTTTGVGLVRVSDRATASELPLPTAVESYAHCTTAGGRATTATRVESLNTPAPGSTSESTTQVRPSATPVTIPVWSTVAIAGARVAHTSDRPGIG